MKVALNTITLNITRLFFMEFMFHLYYFVKLLYNDVQHDFYIRWCSCRLTVTRQVSRVEQELSTLYEQLSSLSFFWGSCCSIFFFCIMFCRSVCPFYFGNCIVCSSIYSFWLNAQWCQFVWIVNSRLPLLLSPTFI